MGKLYLIFLIAGVILASEDEVVSEIVNSDVVDEDLTTENPVNVTEKSVIRKDLEKTEVALKHFVSFLKKEFAQAEDKFESFLDRIESSDFFPNKFSIIKKMVNDVEDTYAIIKQDVLSIKDEIQSLSKVTPKDVIRIMGMCIKVIEDVIVNFEVVLEDWLDLLQPLIIFDTKIIMGPLKLILQLTTMLSTSAAFIELAAKMLEALNDPDSNIHEILSDILEHLGISGENLDELLPQPADSL